MEHLNDNNHFSAEYIRKYLEGKLPADEMHALEKAALDDPFLADAIEGMSMAFENEGQPKVISELEILKQQWANRQLAAESKPTAVVKRFNWWKPAVAAAIIVVAGLVSYQFWFNASQKNELAVVQEKDATAKSEAKTSETEPQKPLLNDTGVTAEQGQTFSTEPTKPSKDIVSNKTVVGKTPVPATVAPSPKKTDPVSIPLEKASDEKTETVSSRLRQDKAPDSLTDLQASKEPEKDKNTEERLAGNVAGIAVDREKLVLKRNTPGISNYFNGQVLNENNEPVSNAIVQLQNTKNAYFTDKNGQFNIPSPDSVIEVAVNSVGYNTQNFTLKNTTNTNQLVLQPDKHALSEVVVAGYGGKKKSDAGSRKQKVLVQDAQPAAGWMEFEKYIEKNKRIITDPSAKTGNVVVSFIINREGKLSNFKIETSLSEKQDQEALRLIKEGPAWKLLKGRRARATVIVSF